MPTSPTSPSSGDFDWETTPRSPTSRHFWTQIGTPQTFTTSQDSIQKSQEKVDFDSLIAWNRTVADKIVLNGVPCKPPRNHSGGAYALEHAQAAFDAEPLLKSYHIAPHPLVPKLSLEIKKLRSPFTFESNGFLETLKQRVRAWQSEVGIKDFYAPPIYLFVWVMHVTAILLLGFFSFYCIRRSWYFLSYCSGFFCSALRAFMLLREGHSGAHYAVSRNPKINWIINQVSWGIISVLCADTLTSSHVEMHHLYPSVYHLDDAEFPGIRTSKKNPWKFWHRYQHYYAIILYALLLIVVPLSDLVIVLSKTRFTKRRIVNSSIIIFFVLFYYLPAIYYKDIILLVCCISPCSLILALTFGVNHHVKSTVHVTDTYDLSKAIEKNEKSIDFGEYQALLTPSYNIKSWITNQLTGGLNLHRTHHILPKVHYSYYPALTEVVEKTLREFNVPVITYPSFLDALKDHFELIKFLSFPENVLK